LQEAYSQFPRPEHPDHSPHNDSEAQPDLTGDPSDKMGYTVRVDGYRYTEWVAFDRPSATANWSMVWGVELYNHSESPVPTSFAVEHTNLAKEPRAAALVKTLHDVLKRQFTKPLSGGLKQSKFN
jgi:iduronate 2-sulfatase